MNNSDSAVFLFATEFFSYRDSLSIHVYYYVVLYYNEYVCYILLRFKIWILLNPKKASRIILMYLQKYISLKKHKYV